MPRRLLIPTVEVGDLDLFVVYARGGSWEAAWEPLRGSSLAELVPRTDKATYDHALRGWTLPLVRALGLPPEGALRKLPAGGRLCAERGGCPLKGPACHPLHKRMPWCFAPGDLPPGPARDLGAEAIRLWRGGVRILVVDKTPDLDR